MRRLLYPVVVALVMFAAPAARGVDWIRGGEDGKVPRWGIRGGLQFAIPPATPGPRGLIRILYPTLPGGAREDSGVSESRPAASGPGAGESKYDLINFIAIEPVVGKVRGYSELERSRLDGVAGKRLWVEAGEMRGELSPTSDGVERLKVVIHVEAFANGAHVSIIVEQRADRPDEISLTVQAEPDSADMVHCILTATMGNRARTRLLWLKDETVSSLKLYPDYKGRDFAAPTTYPLKSLAVTKEGDLLVAITSDEQRPADVRPFPGRDRWYYGGVPVTQFWKKPRGTWRNDLVATVNARYMYWWSRQAIPGGIAFENFELRERFYPLQQFIFGVTRRTPEELGIRGSETRPAAWGVDWMRGGEGGNEPRWGIQGGLQFAIAPASEGPRGLIRVLYPTLPVDASAESRPSGGAKYDLINYLAIQPVVNGKEAYSELERSRADGKEGKRLWVEPAEIRGELSPGPDGTERLKVCVHVEAFANGAHVRLSIEQQADRPDEITLITQAETDSVDMEYCVVTATMGNFARARLLWLKDETVSSLKLYPDYRGDGFASSIFYPLNRLTVTKEREMLVAITTDERRPADARPFSGSNGWYYGGVPVTQFWKKAKGTWRDDLVAIVNGRYAYWGSRQPVPGGVAFENFELREKFYPLQQFTFGITRRTPEELGISHHGGTETRRTEN